MERSTQVSRLVILADMRPRIGIARDLDSPAGCSADEPCLEGLRRAGANAHVLVGPAELVDRRISGLLLCGGAFDIPPAWYGQETRARLDPPREQRSRLERELLDQATVQGLPVLGICNGAQLMVVIRGGTLVQDLASLWPGALDHEQSEARDRAVHQVEISAASKLARVLEATSVRVNSTHHQGIDDPGRGVRVVGRAPDGVVEAIEDPTRPFWIGVQWHPERLPDRASTRLFSAFAEAASRCGPAR